MVFENKKKGGDKQGKTGQRDPMDDVSQVTVLMHESVPLPKSRLKGLLKSDYRVYQNPQTKVVIVLGSASHRELKPLINGGPAFIAKVKDINYVVTHRADWVPLNRILGESRDLERQQVIPRGR